MNEIIRTPLTYKTKKQKESMPATKIDNACQYQKV